MHVQLCVVYIGFATDRQCTLRLQLADSENGVSTQSAGPRRHERCVWILVREVNTHKVDIWIPLGIEVRPGYIDGRYLGHRV